MSWKAGNSKLRITAGSFWFPVLKHEAPPPPPQVTPIEQKMLLLLLSLKILQEFQEPWARDGIKDK